MTKLREWFEKTWKQHKWWIIGGFAAVAAGVIYLLVRSKSAGSSAQVPSYPSAAMGDGGAAGGGYGGPTYLPVDTGAGGGGGGGSGTTPTQPAASSSNQALVDALNALVADQNGLLQTVQNTAAAGGSNASNLAASAQKTLAQAVSEGSAGGIAPLPSQPHPGVVTHYATPYGTAVVPYAAAKAGTVTPTSVVEAAVAQLSPPPAGYAYPSFQASQEAVNQFVAANPGKALPKTLTALRQLGYGGTTTGTSTPGTTGANGTAFKNAQTALQTLSQDYFNAQGDPQLQATIHSEAQALRQEYPGAGPAKGYTQNQLHALGITTSQGG